MNSVEHVKKICKERKIPISRIERELGFANGYISQLKKGSFPAERLKKIADYLNLSPDFLMDGTEIPSSYDIDSEVKEMMYFLYEHPEYKKLFASLKDVQREDIDFVIELIKKISQRK